MKTVNQVYSTMDYSMFKSLSGNRDVNKLHVRRLRESFKTAYLFSPIIVNKNYEIIDGQHRFEAAKELGHEINFIICPDYGLREIQLLNTNMKNWGRQDYLNAYCDLGYTEYLKFKTFMQKFPDLPISGCENILINKSNRLNRTTKELRGLNKRGSYSVRDFEEGRLVIHDYDLAVKNANKIMMLKPYYDGYNRALFINTMVNLFKNENYNHELFIKKLSINRTALTHCANVTQYKLLIEEIYNYKNHNKVSLRY